jgi:hypothetical protein
MSTFGERFWAKVASRTPGECWVWVGSQNGLGYGETRIDGRKVYAHRASYALLVGEIPKGMVLDHVCHNPSCVNPEHLRPCTRSENQSNLKMRSDNSSGLKGASWHKQTQKWRASIQSHGKQIHLGMFETPEAAHDAYRVAAERLHGDFASPDGVTWLRSTYERKGAA